MLHSVSPGGTNLFGLYYVKEWNVNIAPGQQHKTILLFSSHRNANCFLWDAKECIHHINSLFQPGKNTSDTADFTHWTLDLKTRTQKLGKESIFYLGGCPQPPGHH